MFNFCWVRMVGAFKIHLVPNLKSFILLRQFLNNIPEIVKYVFSFVKLLISYVLFRVHCTEELMIEAESAMAACSVEKSMTEQQGLIPSDAVIVNGVQNPGLTPFEEFLPRSAPKIGSSTISYACQIPDITRRTLSALKAQIRVEQGRARELRAKAAEKEEESERSQREERRLCSQADDLGDALIKIEQQEARLDRKITSLDSSLDRHLSMLSDAKQVIWMADYGSYEYD